MSESSRRFLPNNYVSYDLDEGEERLSKIRQRYDEHLSFWGDLHSEALIDDNFIAGKQWAEKIMNQRKKEGRPCLTFNLLPQFCRQVVNKGRQDRPSLKVRPVEGNRAEIPRVINSTGTQDYSLSEVYDGIIRNIEYESRAKDAYDTALTHCVHHGFGWMMLATVEDHEDPFVQHLRIQRVKDSYSVLIDPSAERSDYSDAQDAFTIQWMSKDAFYQRFPDSGMDAGGFGHLALGSTDRWYRKDEIQVATYWWLDWRKEEVVKLTDGRLHYLSDVESVLDDLSRSKAFISPGTRRADSFARKCAALSANGRS